MQNVFNRASPHSADPFFHAFEFLLVEPIMTSEDIPKVFTDVPTGCVCGSWGRSDNFGANEALT